MSYRPLPKEVTIKESDIDGLGLFAIENIPRGKDLGITHVLDSRWPDGYIRLPLGGFYNHSDTPNIENYLDYIPDLDVNVYSIRTVQDIKAGEELVSTYIRYTP
tara:strand:- start:3 stop:314 length:312 start_codon:yes stop_codon:yes gene_type:complete